MNNIINEPKSSIGNENIVENSNVESSCFGRIWKVLKDTGNTILEVVKNIFIVIFHCLTCCLFIPDDDYIEFSEPETIIPRSELLEEAQKKLGSLRQSFILNQEDDIKEEQDSLRIRKIKGLPNVYGNQCYMNAALQFLFSSINPSLKELQIRIKKLTELESILEAQLKNSLSDKSQEELLENLNSQIILFHICEIILNWEENNKEGVVEDSLKKILNVLAYNMGCKSKRSIQAFKYQQQDAVQVFELFLNALGYPGLKFSSKVKASYEIEEEGQKKIKEDVSEKSLEQFILYTSPPHEKVISIQKLLDDNCSRSICIEGWKGPSGITHQKSFNKLSLSSKEEFERINSIFICVKRFIFNGMNAKNLISIQFLEDQNIDLNGLFNLSQDLNRIQNFQLTGFIQHIGETVFRGHYVTYSLEADGKWYLYDDNKTTQVTNEKALEAAAKAYIFQLAKSV